MLILPGALPAPPAETSVRGRLTRAPAGGPALATAARGLICLSGDRPTVGVLNDHRLAESDFEALGRYLEEHRFEVAPIHTRSLFVHRSGRRLYVTYWCELCSIRTYTPGPCWCCQQETALDLREKDDS
jgi:hypothetical protein